MVDVKKLKELSQGLNIIYVEDDSSIRDSMSNYLSKFFKRVVVAKDGVEGLEAYKQESIDLIITDLSMPRMNGLEMLEQIKKIDDSKPTLITSAHSESDFMVGAIKIGIDGYIIKPFDFKQLNQELFKIVEKIHLKKENISYQESLEDMVRVKTQELTEVLEKENENYEETLYSMVEMIEERDTYTAGHSRRVAEYSKLIAEQIGYSREECELIYQAGMLHDIGKVVTPDTVLLNPQKLSEIEYKLIQEHVSVGYKLLSHIPMFEKISTIIVEHHERYDGQGYPQGLKDDEIEPLAQVMIVADAFDAMTTNRIYKPSKDIQEAIEELKVLSGSQFHPKIVDAALVALSSVHIDKGINQLPISVLEQERFAYFYKDAVTHVYNQSYLNVMLIKNRDEREFEYLHLFYLKNFSLYNTQKSWEEGDKFLAAFAELLSNSYDDSFVFRIFGDDFAVLGRDSQENEELKKRLNELFLETVLAYRHEIINLFENRVECVKDISKHSFK